MSKQTHLLLHNIRSVYNVGAIFRTADALGISKIYLSGYTPTPLDRFGAKRKDFAKSALGSENTIVWEHVSNPNPLLESLKREGFTLVAIEQSKKSIDYKKVKTGNKTLVIFGNEVRGMSPSLLKKADIIAEIPMRGRKESLNVSVSAGIALFRFFDL